MVSSGEVVGLRLESRAELGEGLLLFLPLAAPALRDPRELEFLLELMASAMS